MFIAAGIAGPTTLDLMHWSYTTTLRDRDWADQELNESEEQFSLFMDHVPGLVHVKEEERRFVYLNRNHAGSNHFAGERTFGFAGLRGRARFRRMRSS